MKYLDMLYYHLLVLLLLPLVIVAIIGDAILMWIDEHRQQVEYGDPCGKNGKQ